MRLCYILYIVCTIAYANQIDDLIQESLNNNEKIKQLEYQIQALESKSRADAKWDNPKLSILYNSAEVNKPLKLDSSEMQNISIGLIQNIDMNGKRKLKSNITRRQAQIKILELKNLKNQYSFSLIQNAINIYTKKQILNFTQDSIENIDTLLRSLQASNNFNAIQMQKLSLLKAKLEIKKNELENELENSHISISEISFGNIHQSNNSKNTTSMFNWDEINDNELESSNISQRYKINDQELIDTIMQSNYEIVAAKLQDNISLDYIKVAKKEFISDLGVNLAYMLRVNRTDMFTIGFSMPIPMFGAERAKIEQANYENLAQKSQTMEISNRIKHNTMNLISKLKTLKENLSIIDSTLIPANKNIIDIYKHHATSQSGAFIEFYTALNEQIEAQILRLQTMADIAITYYNLQSLKGEI
ncbi:TolC family protein [Helicobacter muridarum]|uniref:Heavy metal RND efflux outer membrane protein,CzcC family n=1 Tax=Helicobacter muridarum TaxID=216 RepID=A0A099TXC6_9HELI|nr:TolC family protein [Helicobacter muridarum]STQ86132.1 heavy metal RND efflux outer membrane protein,CzcC family [Helicobacter muridarum]